MIRVGFIGAGNVASAHLAALHAIESVRIAAYFDPVGERGQERVVEFGGRAVPDLPALWQHVDAVWVCSPPHLHAEHAAAAAAAGRHVFVERPIADNLAAASVIVDACRRAGVRLMVGSSLRFTAAGERMRRLLADGDLGRLVACWSRRFGDVSPAELPWWRRDWRRGGGVTIEWGIQELDFLRWAGETGGMSIRAVHGRTVFSRPNYPDFDDYARATISFTSGTAAAVGGFEAGQCVPVGGSQRAIVGTRATVITEGRGLRLRYIGDGAERTIDVPPATDPERRVSAAMLAQATEFVQAIEQGRRPRVSGEDGRAALALCLAVHRSSHEDREIAADELGFTAA